MKKFIIIILLITSLAYSREYHQNFVDYQIDVTLDDSRHLLQGCQTMTYYNNFPDTLNRVYLLLYPNAYKNNDTQFAKQQKKFKKTQYLKAKAYQRGYISIDSLIVGQSRLSLHIPTDSISTGYLDLDRPLMPNDSVTLYLEWTVKIPASFSRLCHTDQNYYLSQWYPKIPVYDHNGWHSYPYLDLGEYYYEFGNYRVNITLPENYVVAATGDLVAPQSEKNFLDSLARIGKRVINMPEEIFQDTTFQTNLPSAVNSKTLTYEATNVVDFAWTASKEHLVQRRYFSYENSNDSIGVWNFFYPKNRKAWQYALDAAEATLKNYGELCGPYPYPNVTTVDGALIAGGGMEYPMLTIINASTSQQNMWRVIGHEIGHNWFYGILGFNERMQPWMDEGLNTYGEMRFLAQEFPDTLSLFHKFPFLRKKFENISTQNIYQLILNSADYLGFIDPGDLDSREYEAMQNYFISVYNRPAMGLKLMEAQVGEEAFVNAMNNFYREWQFKHPQPADMQVSFEKSLNMNLDWFFTDLIKGTEVPDYELADFDVRKTNNHYESTITIQNNGPVSQPISLIVTKNDRTLSKRWIHTEKDIITITCKTDEKPEKAILNSNLYTMERNYYNNYSTLFPPLDLNLIAEIPVPNKYLLNYIPYLNYNYNEGLKIGGGFYHLSGRFPKNTYLTYGSYGTKSKELNLDFRYFTKLSSLPTRPNFKFHFTHDKVLNKVGGDLTVDLPLAVDTKFKVSGNYVNLQTLSYLEKQYWTTGDFLTGALENEMNIDHGDSKIRNTAQLKWINSGTRNYFKFTTEFTQTHKWKKSTFTNRFYLGSFLGSVQNLPTQYHFFPSGGIDPEFDQFYVYDRSGKTALSPMRNYLISADINLKGYQGSQPTNSWGISYNGKIQRGYLFLFVDVGNVFNRGDDFSLRWDSGVGLDLFLFKFYIPIYVSDPVDSYAAFSKWKALKNRWVVEFTLPELPINF